MRNFRNFADVLSNFPVNEAPVEVPFSNEMPDELAVAAQAEAIEQPHVMPDDLQKKAQQEAIQQAAPKPVPVKSALEENMAKQVLNKFTGITPEGTMAKTAPVGRAPAVEAEAKPETELGRLEKLMQEMNSQRRAELEDAARRQFKANMIKGLTDNIGLLVAGNQAMNTKAAVQAPQVKSIDIGDQMAQVERKFKPEHDQLLAQYKELKDANKPMSEKDKIWADIMYKQLTLGNKRNEDANWRFGEGEERRNYQFGVQQDQKDEYSDKQTEDLKALDNTLSLLDGVEKEFNTGKYNKFLGPYASKFENAQEYNPLSKGMDPDFAKFQSNITDSLSQYIKSLSGLTVSDTERKNLLLAMPKVGDKPETFKAKLEATKERIKALSANNKAALAKYQGKTGKVSKREGSGSTGSFAPEAPTGNTVERRTKDGKIAIFDADTKQFIKYKE